MTQQQVAAKARMDRSYVSDVERADAVVSVDCFMRLCHAIGIPAATAMADVETAEKSRQRP